MDTALFRQCLAAFSGCLAVMMAGTSYGWTSMVLEELLSADSPVPMSTEQSSWMVSIINLGELLSPIPTGVAVNYLGRKVCLLSTAPVYIVSWMMVLNTTSVEVLYTVRVLQGLAMGMVCTILPMYLGEISGSKIRGGITTFYTVMWYIGILYEYIIGAFVSYRTLAYFSLILPVVFFFAFLFIPESPYYLIMKGQFTGAERSLSWLRDGLVILELEDIKHSVEEEQRNNPSWSDLIMKSQHLKNLLIVQVVAIVKFMSGFAAITSFASQTFSATKDSFPTPSQYTIFLGVIIVITNVISGCFVDSVGRRPLFLVSALGCALCETSAAFYYYFAASSSFHLEGYSWIAFLSICLYFAFFSVGLSPLVPTIQAEFFTSNSRSLASAITVSTGTVATFISMKMYQSVAEEYGMYLIFVIFSLFCYVGVVFIYVYVPETKGKTFAEIQISFLSNTDKAVHDSCTHL